MRNNSEYYPESFREVVDLVLADRQAAAGVMWDNTILRAIESEREEPSGFCPGRDK